MNSAAELRIQQAYQKGFDYEQQYHGCAQAIIAALIETEFVDEEARLMEAATGLSGGMGLSGVGNCGAFTGGSMVLSYLHSVQLNQFKQRSSRDAAYDAVYALFRKFTEFYGSCICRDIQTRIFGRSFDLRDPADTDRFQEMGAHTEKCPAVVGNAARWTAAIILGQDF